MPYRATETVGNLLGGLEPPPVGGSTLGDLFQGVLNAPGQELFPSPLALPAMVYQKAGVPALRALLNRQIAKQGDIARTMGITGPLGKVLAPMARRNVEKLERAATGRSITLVGFRQEPFKGGPVPGRGIFFSAKPQGAYSFTPPVKASVRQQKRWSVPGSAGRYAGQQGKRTDVLKFRNPRVAEDAVDLAKRLIPLVPEQLQVAGRKILSRGVRGPGEGFWTKLDKWNARAARHLGHDGIIYQNTDEIVDLVGTETRR